MQVNDFYYWRADTLFLQVRVQPQSRTDKVIGPVGGYLKIRINASPISNKANQRLMLFLARTFAVPLAHISLVKGSNKRNKLLSIQQPDQLPDFISRQNET